MPKTCIIIGASHAASQFSISLRQGGWDGDIIIIGEDTELPYHRPPLSKDFLSGNKTINDIWLRPAQTYIDAKITMMLGSLVDAIDRKNKTVTLDDGRTLSYDTLVLATGARVRKLSIEGADDPRVLYLRTVNDVKAIQSKIAKGRRAVIIGGGYIGLETAASLRKHGMKVTVLEAMDRILQRVTAPIMSDFYRRIHTEEGVDIRESQIAEHITAQSSELTVQTQCGEQYFADLIIVGIGVIPNIELAQACNLETGNGIVVNAFCQTSDSHIYAIGDVTWHYNPIFDRYLRLESVPNAMEQAKTAALHINGRAKPYSSLPWFWSDQYDLKLQIAGLSEGYDDIVIRGDAERSRNFAAFYFKGSQLLAVDAVNAPREFMLSKMVLSKGQTLDKTILADPKADLKSALREP